jgi:hypothetical protein
MKRRTLGLLLLLALACSHEEASAADQLHAAADRVHDIHSGHLTMTFSMAATCRNGDIGFTTDGPFSFADPSSLPVSDLTFTEQLGTNEVVTRFVSDGTHAVAVVNGKTKQLSPAQLEGLQGFAGAGGSGAVPGINLDAWFSAPEITGEGVVAGDPTRVIEGVVDAPEALNGLLTVMAALGGPSSIPALSDQAHSQLEHSVREASARVEIGMEDGLLRRVVLNVVLGVDPSIAPTLSRLTGAHLTFELTIANPNDPVSVQLPR